MLILVILFKCKPLFIVPLLIIIQTLPAFWWKKKLIVIYLTGEIQKAGINWAEGLGVDFPWTSEIT